MTDWISVKDALPEKDGEYLVYDGNIMWISDYIWPLKNGSIFGFGSLFMMKSPFVNNEVTHWMPLPKPPEWYETEEGKTQFLQIINERFIFIDGEPVERPEDK
jgi:hypothetical protein